MRILGIDPGYDRCGVAVVEHEVMRADTLIYSHCITSEEKDLVSRIRVVGKTIQELIDMYHPDAVAIEKLFFNKNQKTALAVAEARGVILGIAAGANLPIFEYSPQEIKLAVTGYGASSKKQVADMVIKLIPIEKTIKYDDEFDAIATALTYLATNKNLC